jgi:hypothetical protein
MLKSNQVLVANSALLLGLLTFQVLQVQSTANSQPVSEPLCYQQDSNGRLADLSKLCNRNNQIPPAVQLANLSKAAIEAENKALVSEDSEVQARLREDGLRYTDFQTELKINNTQIQGNQAIVDATEHTKIGLDSGGDPLTPKYTEYYQDRRLGFNLENGQWKLISNEVVNAPKSQKLPPGLPLIDSSLKSTSKDEEQQENTLLADAGAKLKSSSSLKQTSNFLNLPNELKKFNFAPQLIAHATLNRQAIVNYAYKYWKNYNPAYRRFKDNDCTNFVSQAVRAGGWRDVSGSSTSSSAWWYNSSTQSQTWTVAHSWYFFTKDRPRASLVTIKNNSDARKLEPGDILQADWTGNGVIDHAMIVTARDSKTIYLTFHSIDTKDMSWTALDAKYKPKGVKYYGWRLNSSIK